MAVLKAFIGAFNHLRTVLNRCQIGSQTTLRVKTVNDNHKLIEVSVGVILI